MDYQILDSWIPQGISQGMQLPAHQTTVFEIPAVSNVPSLSGSPASSTYDHFPAPVQHTYYSQIPEEPMQFNSYPLPMTPPDFGSDPDTPYCSPRPLQHAEPVYSHISASMPAERTHTTSGRRRAQNRAAQRAFRERKEKHARDLETQLASLTDRYNKLETSHTELNAAYEKLRKMLEVLTSDDNTDSEGEKPIKRRSSNSDTVRRMLDILHGDFKGVTVKPETS